MPTTLTSTLSELNAKFVAFLYESLNGYYPETWKNSQQVFYSYEDTWEFAVQNLTERRKNNDVGFPFLSITREPDFREDGQDISMRVTDVPTFYDRTVSDGSTPNPMFKVLPVHLTYHGLVFTNSLDHAETLIEDLMFSRGKIRAGEFDSEVVEGFHSYFDSQLIDLPRYVEVPNKKDLIEGRGSVFGILLKFHVDGLIARGATVKPIFHITANIRPNEEGLSEDLPHDVIQIDAPNT